MKISQNWLNDFVDMKYIDAKEFWLKFTLATAEVEDIEFVGQDIKNVVVGHVKEVAKHPKSNKLKIVQVDIGDEIVQSVCGAPNVTENIKIPFAKVGGSVKKIPMIKATTLVGEESNGVCCSGSELGISDNHEGLLILDGNAEVGRDIREIVEIDDVIIEIDNKSLTNRPDLWGHYGVAREVAAILRRPLKKLDVEDISINSVNSPINVSILEKDACPRYSCAVIEGIKENLSSQKIKTRLFRCGVKPINLLVDLTNYVMLELGQPMHAFDRGNIDKIEVRSFNKGEKFITLDGIERVLPENSLMICDQEKPIALAGIMGGENSEIKDYSNAILLESANFEAYAIRKTAVKLGLRTEASTRFEKSLDPNNTIISIKRFIKLLKEIENDIVIKGDIVDSYVKELPEIKIEISKEFIDKIVGIEIDNSRILEILDSLGFIVNLENNIFYLTVPSFRSTKDISIKEDIIEEITRIHGYDNIEPKTVNVPLKPLNYNKENLFDYKVKEILAEKFGLCEVLSYVWYDGEFNKHLGISTSNNIKVLNSQASESDQLRDWMAPVMLSFAAKNSKNFEKMGMFEIGSVFRKDNEQNKNLAILLADKTLNEEDLFYKIKGIVTYLFKSLKNANVMFNKCENNNLSWIYNSKCSKIYYENVELGYITVLNPAIRYKIDKKLNIVIMELNMNLFYNILSQPVKFVEPSKYPEVNIDYSFLVKNEENFEVIWEELQKYRHEFLSCIKFITSYVDKDNISQGKSMTFRFTIGSKEKTLTSQDINIFSQDLLNHMQQKGYTLKQ